MMNVITIQLHIKYLSNTIAYNRDKYSLVDETLVY